jgi:hypothetical protein
VEIVDHLLASCPNATIFLEIVPFDQSTKVKYERATEWVHYVYEHFQAEGNERIFLIDSQTAIGYNLSTDGIHLTTQGQECWYQELVTFAVANDIPQ